MAEKDEELIICIGRITNFFGTCGEVKVHILTDFPERFQNLSSIVLSRSGETRDLSANITGVKYHKKFLIVKLDISNSIEEAKSLKDFFICINRKDLHPLPAGAFYLFELIGLDVYSQEGEFLGKVQEIYKLPANDVFVVVKEKKEILIPAVKEFVDEIKPETGRIVIHSREGLF